MAMLGFEKAAEVVSAFRELSENSGGRNRDSVRDLFIHMVDNLGIIDDVEAVARFAQLSGYQTVKLPNPGDEFDEADWWKNGSCEEIP